MGRASLCITTHYFGGLVSRASIKQEIAGHPLFEPRRKTTLASSKCTTRLDCN